MSLPVEASRLRVGYVPYGLLTAFGSLFSAFLINTSDRVIRVYDSKEIIALGKDGEPEPIQKLQDLVNKLVLPLFLFNK